MNEEQKGTDQRKRRSLVAVTGDLERSIKSLMISLSFLRDKVDTILYEPSNTGPTGERDGLGEMDSEQDPRLVNRLDTVDSSIQEAGVALDALNKKLSRIC